MKGVSLLVQNAATAHFHPTLMTLLRTIDPGLIRKNYTNLSLEWSSLARYASPWTNRHYDIHRSAI